MILPLRINPEAEAEFADAIRWYERHGGIDTALDFATAVDDAIEKVRLTPRRYPVVHQYTRRYLVDRFPYGIFYVVKPNEVQVRAVYHLSRDPAGWRGRS